MAQNAQLQQQQSGTESERDNAVREREELRGVQEQLLRDHERLAALHERQAMEDEALMGKHGCLKKAHRTLELEYRTLQDRSGGKGTVIMPCNTRALPILAGFVRSWKTWKSHGIYKCLLPGLEKSWGGEKSSKFWKSQHFIFICAFKLSFK